MARWDWRHPLLAGRHSTCPTPRGGGETPTHPPTNHQTQNAPLKVGANCFIDHFGSLRNTATPCHNTMSSVQCIVIQCPPHTQSSSLEYNTRSTLSSLVEDGDESESTETHALALALLQKPGFLHLLKTQIARYTIFFGLMFLAHKNYTVYQFIVLVSTTKKIAQNTIFFLGVYRYHTEKNYTKYIFFCTLLTTEEKLPTLTTKKICLPRKRNYPHLQRKKFACH